MSLVKFQVISATEQLSLLNPVTLASRLSGHARKIPEKRSRAHLLRKIIEELGTTYIKFGQWLSVRPDFVPPDLLEELEQLQDRLRPIPFKTIRRTIEQERGQSLEEIFSEFDQYPISTASIAQVHRAVLKTGQEVAVKVQHPHLKQLIRVDLSILRSILTWAVKTWPHLSVHRPEDLISSFKATLMDEIDFVLEAKNQNRLAEIFEDTPWVHIPKVYWEHTTERLLVMEYLHGLKVTQWDRFPQWGLDRKRLASRLSEAYFRQIFEEAFFHSDPHPANVLYLKDNHIGIVDFGIITKFDERLLNKFLDWFYAVIYRDIDLFEQTFLDVGKPLEAIDKIQFRNDCVHYMDEMHFQPAGRISFARVLAVTNRILYRHKISTPPTFLFFFKTISTLEGAARRLDPEFDWREDWGPKLKKIVEDRYSAAATIRHQLRILRDYNRLIEGYPDDLREITRKLKEGSLQIQIRGFSDFVEEMRKAYNKLALSLVISGLILGIFLLAHGQGIENLRGLEAVLTGVWWVVLLLIVVIFVFRKR